MKRLRLCMVFICVVCLVLFSSTTVSAAHAAAEAGVEEEVLELLRVASNDERLLDETAAELLGRVRADDDEPWAWEELPARLREVCELYEVMAELHPREEWTQERLRERLCEYDEKLEELGMNHRVGAGEGPGRKWAQGEAPE